MSHRTIKKMDGFICYIKKALELGTYYEISKLNAPSSNLILLINNNNEKYITKVYNIDSLFKIELFILLNYKKYNLKIPQILYHEEKEKAGWNWIIYKYIEGDSLFHLKKSLTTKQYSDIFFETGKILHHFHNSVNPNEFDDLFYIQKKVIIQKVESNHSILKTHIHSSLFQQTRTFMRENYSLLNSKEDYTLIIKDFNDKHILIKKDRVLFKISGIIDFEMASFSNKFHDFVLLYISYFLDNQTQEHAFIKGYGINLNTVNKKKIAFYIIDYAVELCSTLKDIHWENEQTGITIIKKVFKWLDRTS